AAHDTYGRNSKKIVDYDPRFESILSDIGLDSLKDALKLTPDPELITALVEWWRPETNTFHLYGGEATITLEDVHFITGLSVDGLPVTSPRLIPTDLDELCAYAESQLGKKPATSYVLSGRIKMTWLRSHFAYREGSISDDDIHTIHQYCRAYIVDFFGSCIFADRSGAVMWHRPDRLLRQFGMDQPLPTFDMPRSEVIINLETTQRGTRQKLISAGIDGLGGEKGVDGLLGGKGGDVLLRWKGGDGLLGGKGGDGGKGGVNGKAGVGEKAGVDGKAGDGGKAGRN
ncbi:Protein MAIN-LIKE 2, partial [Linum perenne]